MKNFKLQIIPMSIWINAYSLEPETLNLEL